MPYAIGSMQVCYAGQTLKRSCAPGASIPTHRGRRLSGSEHLREAAQVWPMADADQSDVLFLHRSKASLRCPCSPRSSPRPGRRTVASDTTPARVPVVAFLPHLNIVPWKYIVPPLPPRQKLCHLQTHLPKEILKSAQLATPVAHILPFHPNV